MLCLQVQRAHLVLASQSLRNPAHSTDGSSGESSDERESFLLRLYEWIKPVMII